jgi:TatD DNase family protein
MFSGQVDRRGSREGKKSSLRRNKQVLNDLVHGKHLKPKAADRPSFSVPAPPLSHDEKILSVIDCGCRLMNRQFDRDMQRVIQRAIDAHVEGIVIFNSDYDKQEQLLTLCKQNSGVVYAALGIHPDNIKHTHDKKSADRLDALKEFALSAECVAIFCGLDFSREFATRYAQEKHLDAQLTMALDVHLPVMLSETGAAERLIELLSERRDALPPLALYGLTPAFPADALTALLAMDAYFVLTGSPLCDTDAGGDAMRALAARLPLSRVLLASDAPMSTPQSIPDAHMREGRNQPATLGYVVQALAAAHGIAPEAAAAAVRANAKLFYGFRDVSDVAAAPDAAAAAAAPAVDAADRAAAAASDSESDGSEHSAEQPPARKAPVPQHTHTKPAKHVTVAEAAPAAAAAALSSESEGEVAAEMGTAADLKAEAAAAAAAAAGEAVTYACKACRRVVFGASDIVPHREAAATFDAGSSCQMLFTGRLDWMRLRPDAQGEGKLACPECGAKLGRFSTAAPLVCSCGRAAPAPAFRIGKARVDLLVSGSDATLLQSMADSSDEDAFGGGMARKTKKKKKKTVRASHAGNFSSFRNKST